MDKLLSVTFLQMGCSIADELSKKGKEAVLGKKKPLLFYLLHKTVTSCSNARASVFRQDTALGFV